MDSRICQTSTATPAEPGGLPFVLRRVVILMGTEDVDSQHEVRIWQRGSERYAQRDRGIDHSLGDFVTTLRALRALVGDELLWAEPQTSTAKLVN